MNWNLFTRKALIWPILVIAFFVCFFGIFLIRLAFSGASDEVNENAMKVWGFVAFGGAIGVCSVLRPILKKTFVGSKYPLKRKIIRPKDLTIGDIVTLSEKECVFDGYYDGYYLFAPKGEINGEEDYIRLKKGQIQELVCKVVSPEYGLKWERPKC